jgi:hypothetical protein
VQFRSSLEKWQAPNGIGGRAAAVFDADVKVLASRLPKLNADSAASVNVAAGKAHVGAKRPMLRVKVDVPREWQ